MKNLYCPKCKTYPENIIEVVTVNEYRQWDDEEDCYVLVDPEYNNSDTTEIQCSICGTELEEK